MRVIAISGYAESGKSTVADILVREYGYARVKFADPLKNMLRAIGLGEAEIEGERKELPCALLQGKTPRHAMVTLGTEWGRDMIGSNFWTGLWLNAVGDVWATGRNVVVDDCRFPNEAEVVHGLGGEVWRVRRAGQVPRGHISESGVDALDWDHEILNDVTGAAWRDHLENQVRGYVVGDHLAGIDLVQERRLSS